MGLGIDIVEVERIKKAIETTKGFREKVFTANEISYCDKRKNKYENYAGRFAAKEALVKALGQGFTKYSFLDIEITNDELGKPTINFKGKKIDVSISHEKHYAVAMVIIEEE